MFSFLYAFLARVCGEYAIRLIDWIVRRGRSLGPIITFGAKRRAERKVLVRRLKRSKHDQSMTRLKVIELLVALAVIAILYFSTWNLADRYSRFVIVQLLDIVNAIALGVLAILVLRQMGFLSDCLREARKVKA